jgi:hypothetical protein
MTPNLSSNVELMSAAFDQALTQIEDDRAFADCDRNEIRNELSQIIAKEAPQATEPSALARVAVGLMRQREQIRHSKSYASLRGKQE